MDLKKRFNAVKGDEFPWVYESPRDANAQPFADLQAAFRNFFDKRAGRPTFKKKNKCRDSFYVANDKFSLDGRRVRLPKIGHVKMREALRFQGKILGARVSRSADRWFLSVQVETELRLLSLSKDDTGESQDGVIGVDLGLHKLATLSDGTTFDNPRPLRKLRRLSRRLSRKVKGSANHAKAARASRPSACPNRRYPGGRASQVDDMARRPLPAYRDRGLARQRHAAGRTAGSRHRRRRLGRVPAATGIQGRSSRRAGHSRQPLVSEQQEVLRLRRRQERLDAEGACLRVRLVRIHRRPRLQRRGQSGTIPRAIGGI